jgi:hypothetical protein
MLNRSEISSRIIFAALWWNQSQTWENEYSEENKVVRANEREIREGRRLLIDLVSELAQDVEEKIMTEMKKSVALALKAKVRALSLSFPNLMSQDVKDVIKLMTSTSFRTVGESWRLSGLDLIDQINTFENYVESGISARQGERGKIRFAEDLELKVNVVEQLMQNDHSLSQTEEMDSRLNLKIQSDFETWNQLIDKRLELDALSVAEFVDSFVDVEVEELRRLVIQLSAVFEGLLTIGKVPQRLSPNAYRGVLESLDKKYEEIGQILEVIRSHETATSTNESVFWEINRSHPELEKFSSSIGQIIAIALELNEHLQSLVGNENSIDIAGIRTQIDKTIIEVESFLELADGNE